MYLRRLWWVLQRQGSSTESSRGYCVSVSQSGPKMPNWNQLLHNQPNRQSIAHKPVRSKCRRRWRLHMDSSIKWTLHTIFRHSDSGADCLDRAKISRANLVKASQVLISPVESSPCPTVCPWVTEDLAPEPPSFWVLQIENKTSKKSIENSRRRQMRH